MIIPIAAKTIISKKVIKASWEYELYVGRGVGTFGVGTSIVGSRDGVVVITSSCFSVADGVIIFVAGGDVGCNVGSGVLSGIFVAFGDGAGVFSGELVIFGVGDGVLVTTCVGDGVIFVGDGVTVEFAENV